MTVAIKICGVREPAVYDLVTELRVKWVGLVFHPASPRYLTAVQASQLPDYRQQGPLRVGLFVRSDLDEIKRVLDKVRLDILQLYVSESQAIRIRQELDIPVWLAKGIGKREDLPTSCAVDGMVIEAPAYASDRMPGGNGRVFDWSLTVDWPAPRPWLLAGGLNPDNVRQAIQISRTQAVDVSSGVESERGVKDPVLIRNFVENVRQH